MVWCAGAPVGAAPAPPSASAKRKARRAAAETEAEAAAAAAAALAAAAAAEPAAAPGVPEDPAKRLKGLQKRAKVRPRRRACGGADGAACVRARVRGCGRVGHAGRPLGPQACSELRARLDGGEDLNEDQRAKLAGEAALLAEIAALSVK